MGSPQFEPPGEYYANPFKGVLHLVATKSPDSHFLPDCRRVNSQVGICECRVVCTMCTKSVRNFHFCTTCTKSVLNTRTYPTTSPSPDLDYTRHDKKIDSWSAAQLSDKRLISFKKYDKNSSYQEKRLVPFKKKLPLREKTQWKN